jgi:hypothetical protein
MRCTLGVALALPPNCCGNGDTPFRRRDAARALFLGIARQRNGKHCGLPFSISDIKEDIHMYFLAAILTAAVNFSPVIQPILDVLNAILWPLIAVVGSAGTI